MDRYTTLDFLKSAFTTDSTFFETEKIIKWLVEQNKAVNVQIGKTSFNNLKHWKYERESGSIKHQSGKFFSIEGTRVKTNWGKIEQWDQPIINQPEVGYLGFLVKEMDGTLHFLVQAKIEPGNVNHVQLSPTLQATRSNYTQVHKGKKPLYLEYFQNAKPEQILLDQLQSEQGARFLTKRNRNIIVYINEEIPLYENFTWLSLAQLKILMQYDNIVNMDARTVISGIPYGTYSNDIVSVFDFLGIKKSRDPISRAFLKSALTSENSLHTIEEIITFLTHLKSTFDLDIEKIALNKMENWVIDDEEIYHKDRKYFKVIGVDVAIGNREVINWSQPMVEPVHEGLCAFVCKEINGILHFAVQAKLECGNHDVFEFAPTVQTLTGNYKETKPGQLPFLEYVLKAKKEQIVFDVLQSEEGGRFYKEQNRNMIVIAGEDLPFELPENYIWMTLNQLYVFLKFNNYLNIQSRSLIAAISFV